MSPCRVYRYWLERDLGPLGVGTCGFLMLNPSTADATKNDPTVRRCIGYATEWGYRTLVVVNIFALRSTDPARLRAVRDPVGPENNQALTEAHAVCDMLVGAWGNHGALMQRGDIVRGMLPQLHALRMTKTGEPAHPLYLPRTLKPFWMAPGSQQSAEA